MPNSMQTTGWAQKEQSQGSPFQVGNQSWAEAKLCPLPELLDPNHLLLAFDERTILSSESTGKDTGLGYCGKVLGDGFLSTTHGLL